MCPIQGPAGWLLRSARGPAAGSAARASPQLRGLATQAYRPDSAAQDPATGGRTFVDMSIFKGKGALNLKVLCCQATLKP